MDWTQDRIDALTKLWREGLSASQVARQLGGLSRNAVIGKLHRLGLALRDAPSRPRPVAARATARFRKGVGGAGARGRTLPRPAATSPAPAMPAVAPLATIYTLADHGCRWPIGEPDEPGFGFCGRPRGPGPYCCAHAPMANHRRRSAMSKAEIESLMARYA